MIINSTFATIVIIPIEIPVESVNAYANEDTGDTPRLACMEKLTPRERKNKPIMYKHRRLAVEFMWSMTILPFKKSLFLIIRLLPIYLLNSAFHIKNGTSTE